MSVESIVSSLIGASALGLAVWQGYLTRKHNRLTVKPNIRIDRNYSTNPLELSILNTGLGPAIISSIQVTVDNIVIVAPRVQVLNDALRKIWCNQKNLRFHIYFDDEYICAGENHFLVSWQSPNSQESTVFIDQLQRLSIVVAYKSIYGEHFKTYG
jgi:hypothetical protein